MAAIPVGQAVLQDAVTKLGGIDRAAARFGLRPSVLTLYLGGAAPVPGTLLLRAVDIVLDEFQEGPRQGSQPFSRMIAD